MIFRLLLLFILLPYSLFAQTLQLTNNMDGINSLPYMEIFEDPTHKITIEEVKTKPFKLQENFNTSHGLNSSVWWVHMQVQNGYSHDLTWSIKLVFGLIDHVEVWQFSNSSLIKKQLKGDHNIDASQTSYSDRSVYTFTTDAESENEIYFKIFFEQSGYVELFSNIWSPDYLTPYLEKNINILVAVFAGMFVLLLYNLFILLVLKRRIYFWYILYLFGVLLSLLTFNQVGAHYIWGGSTFLIDLMPILSFVIVNVSFLLFTRRFLETYKRLKKIDILITIFIVINLIILLLAVIDFRLLATKLLHLSSFSFFFLPFVGAYLWNKGFKIARGYAIASSILSITITITLLRAWGFVPTSEVMYWIPRMGFVVEGVLLALALADRLNIIQQTYVKAQENLNHSLEKEVKKRTFELEEAKKIAENLARKDTLTGVWNRRAFLEMAQLEIDNAHRHNIPLSMVMIDIDNFKSFNDNYGHKIGDIVIKLFADNLNGYTRDTDIFARIGGEEFVMVLPFSDIYDAKNKAESLRAKAEQLKIDAPNIKLHTTASFGVAQLKDAESLESLLSRADNAMYYVKNSGRNGVHCDGI
ncbi:MAG: diguanylate cyclase [Helicobacteraceae bacterium]|nr:diguanylate cyclase [Helicobacteraceae bacterium]